MSYNSLFAVFHGIWPGPQKTSDITFFEAIFVPAAPRWPQIIKHLFFDSNLNMILYILSSSYFLALVFVSPRGNMARRT